MVRVTVRTFFDRVLDLPWLLVDCIRRAASTLRRRSPDALDVLARPVLVGGPARAAASGARRALLALADVLGGLTALVRQRRFRPLAPRVFALVGAPLATVAIVLAVAAQAPSIVRGADQGVLAVAMSAEEPAAAAVVVRAEATTPARTSPVRRVEAVRSFAKVSRAASKNAHRPSVARSSAGRAASPAAPAYARAAAAPPTSARKARPFVPKAAPRVRTSAPRPDAGPRRRKSAADEAPKADDPPKVDETPKEDDRGDDDRGGSNGGGGGGNGGGDDDERGERDRGDGGGDDDRGKRDRDDDDRGKRDRGDDDRDDRDRDRDEDDRGDEDDD